MIVLFTDLDQFCAEIPRCRPNVDGTLREAVRKLRVNQTPMIRAEMIVRYTYTVTYLHEVGTSDRPHLQVFRLDLDLGTVEKGEERVDLSRRAILAAMKPGGYLLASGIYTPNGPGE